MTSRRIVLVGFMGCGKTTVGQELARQLGSQFVDLDTFISENIGRTPAEIIREDGEPAFRSIETHALQGVLKKKNSYVIALGGGAWTIQTNRVLIEHHQCLTVWLDAPFDLCWKRITSADYYRPLAPDPNTAQELYKSRLDDYALAAIHVEVGQGDSVEAIADKIVGGLAEP